MPPIHIPPEPQKGGSCAHSHRDSFTPRWCSQPSCPAPRSHGRLALTLLARADSSRPPSALKAAVSRNFPGATRKVEIRQFPSLSCWYLVQRDRAVLAHSPPAHPPSSQARSGPCGRVPACRAQASGAGAGVPSGPTASHAWQPWEPALRLPGTWVPRPHLERSRGPLGTPMYLKKLIVVKHV